MTIRVHWRSGPRAREGFFENLNKLNKLFTALKFHNFESSRASKPNVVKHFEGSLFLQGQPCSYSPVFHSLQYASFFSFPRHHIRTSSPALFSTKPKNKAYLVIREQRSICRQKLLLLCELYPEKSDKTSEIGTINLLCQDRSMH